MLQNEVAKGPFTNYVGYDKPLAKHSKQGE